jgi:hypothetical protein
MVWSGDLPSGMRLAFWAWSAENGKVLIKSTQAIDANKRLLQSGFDAEIIERDAALLMLPPYYAA